MRPGGLGDGDPVLDLLLARGGDQDLRFVGIVRRGADNLEVEVDLVQRERDVLVGLGFDQHLEILFLLAGGDDDLLGDHHRRRKRQGDVAVAAPEALVGALQRIADQIEVGDVAVGDDIADQRLDRVAFEPIGALPVSASSTSLIAVELMSTPISDGYFVLNVSSRELSFSASMGTLGAMLIIYIKDWQQV